MRAGEQLGLAEDNIVLLLLQKQQMSTERISGRAVHDIILTRPFPSEAQVKPKLKSIFCIMVDFSLFFEELTDPLPTYEEDIQYMNLSHLQLQFNSHHPVDFCPKS